MRFPRLSQVHRVQIVFKGGNIIEDWFQEINVRKTRGNVESIEWILDNSNQILSLCLDEIACIRTVKRKICFRVR